MTKCYPRLGSGNENLEGEIQPNWPRLRLPPERIAELQADTALADRNPLIGLSAQVKLLAVGGHYSHAHKLLRLLESEHSVPDGDQEVLRRLWPAAILAHAPDLALSWLETRFRTPYRIEIEIARRDVPVDVTLMRVQGDLLQFQLSQGLFEFHAADMVLSRWIGMFPLWHAFMTSPERIDGNVAINLLDHGVWPGLAFCDFRPEFYLIPDSTFMGLGQYAQYRAEFRANVVPWEDRIPIAYWRGSTSGIQTDPAIGWRSLPRIRLCEIATANPGLIDAGITGISQIDDPAARTELEARNLTRPRVRPLDYQNYRYQIDIDGNSNAWDGFVLRLLTGSPVLKIASPMGFRQWYYDRLIPWVNYVPVASDMGDLVEKTAWLRDNDDAARKIGDAGRALAESLDEREITRAIPVIAGAMRADAGGPLLDFRFGAGAPNNTAPRGGWHAPNQDGLRPSGPDGHLVLPRPPGSGDYILMAEVSADNGSPGLVTIVANGTPTLSQWVSGRRTIYGLLPRSVVATADELNLTIGFPAGSGGGPDGGLAGGRPSAAMLHRIGVATADRLSWIGYPSIDAMLAEMNAAQTLSDMHDLGWHGPERARLAPPRDATPRTMRTHFGTIVYADRETGRLRHGDAATMPRNLFLIQSLGFALLVRLQEDGGYVVVRIRPQGPHAPRDDWALWAGGGFARAFTIVPRDGGQAAGFSLQAAGLFACAEHNGDFTLSRLQPAEWELFRFEPGEE